MKGTRELSVPLLQVLCKSSFLFYKKQLVAPAQRHSSSVCVLHFSGPGFTSSDPRQGPVHCLSSHAVTGIPHIRYRKMSTDVSSGPVFLSKNRRIDGRCQLGANLPQKKRRNFFYLSIFCHYFNWLAAFSWSFCLFSTSYFMNFA